MIRLLTLQPTGALRPRPSPTHTQVAGDERPLPPRCPGGSPSCGVSRRAAPRARDAGEDPQAAAKRRFVRAAHRAAPSARARLRWLCVGTIRKLHHVVDHGSCPKRVVPCKLRLFLAARGTECVLCCPPPSSRPNMSGFYRGACLCFCTFCHMLCFAVRVRRFLPAPESVRFAAWSWCFRAGWMLEETMRNAPRYLVLLSGLDFVPQTFDHHRSPFQPPLRPTPQAREAVSLATTITLAPPTSGR